MKTIVIKVSLLALSLMVLPITMAFAQAPDEIPSAEISAKVQARSLEFLKAVERLSPHKDTNDPDASQAFPRATYSRFRMPDGIIKNPRPANIKILGGKRSGSSGLGNYWTVSYDELESLWVAISSKTEKPIGFFDRTLIDALNLQPPKDWADCISVSVAQSRALEYLKHTGIDMSNVVIYEVRPTEQGDITSQSDRTWEVYFNRIYNGVPVSGTDFSVDMDAAEGRLISITGRVEMPSIQDTALVITQEQALSKGRSLLLQKGNRLVGDIAAQLAYTCSSNGWTAKSYKEITYTLPYHLIWRVESSTQDEYGGSPGICAVGLDATTGEITGYGATLFRGGQSVVAYINGGEMGTFLRQASQLILTPLSPSVSKTTRRLTAFEGKRPNESKMLIAASDARKFYGALSGLIRALKFPKPLVFRATHQLTVSLRSGEKRILLFDRVTGYMKYQQRGETLYYLPGSALKKWMTS